MAKSKRRQSADQALNEAQAALRDARKRIAEARVRQLKGEEGSLYLTTKNTPLTGREYRTIQKTLRRFGLWSKPGNVELTTGNKAALRRQWNQFEDLMQGAVFAEYPKGARKATRNQINREINKHHKRPAAVRSYFSGEPVRERIGARITKRGIFLPRSKGQIKQPVGRLRFDRGTGLWAVDVRKRAKAGYEVQEVRYIAGSEALERVKGKMQKRFDRLSGKLKRNQRLSFMIGRNESRRTFRNWEQLFRYAARYRTDDAARATFLNELVVTVMEKGPGKRRKDRSVYNKPVAAFLVRTGHVMDPDLIEGFMEDEDES